MFEKCSVNFVIFVKICTLNSNPTILPFGVWKFVLIRPNKGRARISKLSESCKFGTLDQREFGQFLEAKRRTVHFKEFSKCPSLSTAKNSWSITSMYTRKCDIYVTYLTT